MKFFKYLVLLIFFLIFAFGGRMFWFAQQSKKTVHQNVGMQDGLLKACDEKPNCVSSTTTSDHKNYIEPIRDGHIMGLWDDLNVLLPDQPGFTLVSSRDDYLHFTSRTPLLGFIDDVEFQLIEKEGLIHMRSKSRVGYSDLGANRKRMEKIRSLLQPKVAEPIQEPEAQVEEKIEGAPAAKQDSTQENPVVAEPQAPSEANGEVNTDMNQQNEPVAEPEAQTDGDEKK